MLNINHIILLVCSLNRSTGIRFIINAEETVKVALPDKRLFRADSGKVTAGNEVLDGLNVNANQGGSFAQVKQVLFHRGKHSFS